MTNGVVAYCLPQYPKWRLPEGQTTLGVTLRVDPPTLDPTLDSVLGLILAQVMKGLYRFRGDGTIEPAGAESCELLKDAMTYTIKLRQDAVWSDGELVIAQHYVDSIIRLLNPATPDHFVCLPYPGVAYMGLNLRRPSTDKLFTISPTRSMALPWVCARSRWKNELLLCPGGITVKDS